MIHLIKIKCRFNHTSFVLCAKFVLCIWDHFVYVLPSMDVESSFLTELSGVDLFIADLKALEAYAAYFYCLPKIWSKPLPEVYDAQSVADYFNCRPHVVALRLVEVVFCILSC